MLFLPASFIYAQGSSRWLIDKIVGETAPDFTLKNLSDQDITLSSFKGKPVVLNFWATWCPYCRHERPDLKSLYEKFKDNDLVIVAVSTDRSSGTVKRFMEQNPAPYIVLTDPEGWAAVPYNIIGLPTTYLIDRKGKISRKFSGPVNWKDKHIEEIIQKLITEN